mgnify:FL=1
MIDHITLHVSNAERSIAFYTKALSPLGYIPKAHHEPTIGFGVDDGTPRSDFYISPMDDPAQQPIPTHIAFRTTNEQAVRDFYEAAITAGGMDNGRPGPRAYHSGYYAAFVLDPDGNNIELSQTGRTQANHEIGRRIAKSHRVTLRSQRYLR